MALRLEGLSVTNPNGLNPGSSFSFSSSAVPLPSLPLAATMAYLPLGLVPHRSLPLTQLKAPSHGAKATLLLLVVLEVEEAGTVGRRNRAGEEEVAQGQQRGMAAARVGGSLDRRPVARSVAAKEAGAPRSGGAAAPSHATQDSVDWCGAGQFLRLVAVAAAAAAAAAETTAAARWGLWVSDSE